VIFAMDPGARGRIPVTQFQVAAEAYGYIVAGSNISRNGSWNSSLLAVQAMAADVGKRFVIDSKRIYAAGMSGGARVAMQVALTNNQIAGVIASSAGYPDSEPRKSVPFGIFATAGTEDLGGERPGVPSRGKPVAWSGEASLAREDRCRPGTVIQRPDHAEGR